MSFSTTRRRFLASGAATLGLGAVAGVVPARAGTAADGERVFALIGAGIRGKRLITQASAYARCAVICDLDQTQARGTAERLKNHYANHGLAAPAIEFEDDYRRLLGRRDLGLFVIATPDHWHTKIAVESLHAGKDLYCEKPLTVTIEEGRQIEQAVEATGRVVCVGTQQRSDARFQTAAAMVRAGRIGRPQRVTCAIDGSPSSTALPTVAPPSELNWNRWLGPAPYVAYREDSKLPTSGYGTQHPHGRGHAHFRWWYEYAGGKLTDWGAHHVDIAMWALDKSTADIGPYKIEPLSVTHPVEFVDGDPVVDDRFNTATAFHVRVTFADGVELDIRDDAPDLGFGNGVMLQGDAGRILVNRSKLTGKPVEELEANPLPESAYEALHPSANPEGGDHMANFFACVAGESTPISDVASHHRHLTVCHAANLALRLGRTLTFDPAEQRFLDDDRANEMLSRPARAGFETHV